MEVDGGGAENNVEATSPTGASGPGSRWNPTKEQISMLEELYRQGVRTPSAEQIREITGRLQAYGHIEGKNVFYWFQNHKARQRQKQKQDNLAFFNRCYQLPRPSPRHVFIPPPPCPNVVCGPYLIPQSEIGFYQPPPQYPKVLLPGRIKKRLPATPSSDKFPITKQPCGVVNYAQPMSNFAPPPTSYVNSEQYANGINHDSRETLPLFPVHPTGILQGNAAESCSSGLTETSGCCIDQQVPTATANQTFFDFFYGNSPPVSH